jgi:mannose-1-phosphate guanylyltransferase
MSKVTRAKEVYKKHQEELEDSEKDLERLRDEIEKYLKVPKTSVLNLVMARSLVDFIYYGDE